MKLISISLMFNITQSLAPVKSNMRSLFKMSRPVTIPQAALLVFSGARVAHVPYYEFVHHDFLISTGLCILTCSNSMIINDFFDAEKHTDKEEKNLIVAGVIDKKEVLNFLFFSYLLEIFGILSLDSLDLSLIISTSLLITVLYTPLFKPVAWLKNISVAIVVASTPLVGALSAGGDSNYDNVFKMCVAIFFSIMHKEIIMDILDLDDDLNSGIVTIPGKYGIDFALNVSISLSFLTFLIAQDSLLQNIGALSMFLGVLRCKTGQRENDDEKFEDVLRSFKYTSAFLIWAFVSSNS